MRSRNCDAHHRADSALAVAESRNFGEFVATCGNFASQVMGVTSLGIYLLHDDKPLPYCSVNAPAGFLQEYQHGLASGDPLIAAVTRTARPLAGSRLRGEYMHNVGVMQSLLQRWRYNDNICAPVYFSGKLQALIFAAGFERQPVQLEQEMTLLARSSALAMSAFSGGGAQSDGLAPPSQTMPVLPSRLLTVASLICDGNTNKEIARHLDLSPHTIKDYVDELIKRLGAQNRAGIAAIMTSSAHAGQERSVMPQPINLALPFEQF